MYSSGRTPAPPATEVGTLTNEATVSGGGAGVASTTKGEGETTITPPVPFGFASFNTNVEELASPFGLPSPSNPLTQRQLAGGHPYQYTTNSCLITPTSTKNGLAGGSGGAKSIEVELPPGFVGDVQNTPQCPLKLLGQCPADTAVGYIAAGLGGSLKNGKVKGFPSGTERITEKESLVWNMEPAPGHPATLGFVVDHGIPFTLEATVRSGGDYGVTVGDNAQSNAPRVLGAQVVTCENGAIELSPIDRVCNTAPANAKPFLANPTQCAGPAPLTATTANSWLEPNGFATMQAYANGPSAKEYSEADRAPTRGTAVADSFLEGCEQLEFKPEIQFKPSAASEGGTSQADEPTGMTFKLKLPQTDEVAQRATPELKKIEMKLPEGMTASPSAAGGLSACTKARFWPSATEEREVDEGKAPEEESLTEARVADEHREPAVSSLCPQKSQIGTVEVFTPLLSGAPTTEGLLSPGNALICTPGDWSGSPQLSYQWLREGKPIPEASTNQYAPLLQDERAAIQCQVTASGKGGGSVAVSRPAVATKLFNEETLRKEGKPVAPPLPPSSIAAPSGTPTSGNTLTCQSGAWSGSPTSFEYTWLRSGAEIPGAGSGRTTATSSTYTLKPEDEGSVVQCEVSATNVDEELKAGKVQIVGDGALAVADSAAVVVSPAPSSQPPLPGAPLQGKLFEGQPECSPCTQQDAEDGKLLPLFIEVRDPLGLPPEAQESGLIVKLHGITKVAANGQLTSFSKTSRSSPLNCFSSSSRVAHARRWQRPRCATLRPRRPRSWNRGRRRAKAG